MSTLLRTKAKRVRSHDGPAATIADILNAKGIPRQDGSVWAKHHIDYIRKQLKLGRS